MELEYEEDTVAMVAFSYLKQNTDKYLISPAKHSQILYSCLITHFITDCLLICMLYELKTEYETEGSLYSPNFSGSFPVFFVKFPCCLALHFVLCPEVSNGMNIMKFANNNPE
jgi:hypothetical protein